MLELGLNPDQVFYCRGGVKSNRFGKLNELNHVNLALSTFQHCNVRLISPQFLGYLRLS